LSPTIPMVAPRPNPRATSCAMAACKTSPGASQVKDLWHQAKNEMGHPVWAERRHACARTMKYANDNRNEV
jgi:hypothetical protein